MSMPPLQSDYQLTSSLSFHGPGASGFRFQFVITDSIFDKSLYIGCSKIICRQEVSVEKPETI